MGEEISITRKALRIISVNMGTFIVCFQPINLSLVVRCGADAAGNDCNVLNTLNSHCHTCITITFKLLFGCHLLSLSCRGIPESNIFLDLLSFEAI